MGSKLLSRFDQWLHETAPSRTGGSRVETVRRELPMTGSTGRHRRPPFYLRWWLGAHRD